MDSLASIAAKGRGGGRVMICYLLLTPSGRGRGADEVMVNTGSPEVRDGRGRDGVGWGVVSQVVPFFGRRRDVVFVFVLGR